MRILTRTVPKGLAVCLASAVVCAVMVTTGMAPSPSPSPSPSPGDPPPPWYGDMSELYPDGTGPAQQQMSDDMANGFDFHSVLTSGERQLITSKDVPFAYFSVPDSANVGSCYPYASDPNTDSLLTSLTQQLGPDVWRLGAPEFDQGGGCWASGRPSFAGMTDQQAYQAWMNFYLNTKGLGTELDQTEAQRGYRWMSLCVFAFCPQYAYDMGADAVLLERNEDEISGITPGLAMLRGASVEHGGKTWGVDLSTWRYWNNGPTVYTSSGKLVTGWSTDTFLRNMMISYMGGANVIENEAAVYFNSDGTLNPLGQLVQQFTQFTMDHPDRGTPYVPFAIMQSHDSGFEPKFGQWMQGNSKWYWNDPYTSGDTMLSNLFSMAYPGYNTWGTIVSGAPWKVTNSDGSINISASQQAYQQQLANGADPRQWEPFGSSRWGEDFDVITDQSSLATLQQYRVIILSTGTPIDATMLNTLTQYVQGGGTLVINAKQLSSADQALTGVGLTTTSRSASQETWVPDGSTITENPYTYTVVTPGTASVLATAPNGDPIVTDNAVGAGSVYVTTPDYLEDSAKDQILNVGQRLITTLQQSLAPVTVTGPQLEYLVNTSDNQTIVTLVNTNLSGATWNGTLTFPKPASSYSASEWTQNTSVSTSQSGGSVVINAQVPAYGVRVYVLTTS